MRVLYIAHESGGSGASLALDNIISAMKDEIEVIAVFPNKRGTLYQKCVSMGIDTYSFPYTLFIYPNERMKWYKKLPFFLYVLFTNWIAVHKLKEIVNKRKPDIIHTNVGPLKIGYVVAKKLGIPHVWHIREFVDLQLNMHPIPSLKKYVELYSDRNNVCIGITDSILNHYNLHDNGVKIYDGVLSLEETEYQDKGDYFLFVGRLESGKGDLILLEQYAEYVKRGGKFKLKYLGDGTPERKQFLLRKINDYGLWRQVELLGYRRDVNTFMSRARATFVPSIYEGFGFISVEAMYNHCLVVGRNTGGIKEQFDNGFDIVGHEIGIRFNDDSELVDIMLQIENSTYKDIIDSAYQVVRQLYTKDYNIKMLLDLYKNIQINRK